jgi:hypothetical protein
MANGPIVPSGYYYTPALRSMGAQGFFEGALGGLDRVQAQDLARERLRGMREERQFRAAERAEDLQRGLSRDALSELMAGGLQPGRTRGSSGGRYSTARERAAGGASPISQVAAEQAAMKQHQDAAQARAVVEALASYEAQLAEDAKKAVPVRQPIVDAGLLDAEAALAPRGDDFSVEEIAMALQRDASFEDPVTRSIRALSAEADAAAPAEIDDRYRDDLAAMSDEEFDAEEMRGIAQGVLGDADRAIASRLDPAGLEEWAARTPEIEGWSDDPISQFAKSLRDPGVDARSAPPAFSAIESAIDLAESPEEKSALTKAYQQLKTGVAAEARARRSFDPEAQEAADTQIEEAMKALDPGLLSAMNMVKPEFGAGSDENIPQSERDYLRKMEMYSREVTPEQINIDDIGIWNPAVDIGLEATTILDPGTLAKIGSLSSQGNPMAKEMLARMGSEPVSAQEAIKSGLVGDVAEYRSKLAAHLSEDQQLLRDAGASDDEMARAFIYMQNKIHGEGTFDINDPEDLALANYVTGLHPSVQKAVMDQLHSQTEFGRKMTLEDAETARKKIPSRVINISSGKGRREDISLLNTEIDSLEKLWALRSRKMSQRSDAAYTPEKFPDLDEEIATLNEDIESAEKRVERIRSRVYPREASPKKTPPPTGTPTPPPTGTPTPTSKAASKRQPLTKRSIRKGLRQKLRGKYGEAHSKVLDELTESFESRRATGEITKEELQLFKIVRLELAREEDERREEAAKKAKSVTRLPKAGTRF